MDEQRLQEIVRRVVEQLRADPTSGMGPTAEADGPGSAGAVTPTQVSDDMVPDIRQVDYRQVYAVPNPENPEEFRRVKSRTWARLGQGRSGPRYRTASLLRFWADNAAAMDAVFTDVSQELLDRLGMFTVQTRCASKDEYLTRPDLGAKFDPDVLEDLKQRCLASPEVQVCVSDGLSSTAVEANVPDLLAAIEQGLKLHGLTMGTPFFIKYGRVRSMEPISEALGATVTCILLGERPGLATPESLSAYLAFKAKVGMSESERTCVSNIHREGTTPMEAGAHIADLIDEMMRQQTSGIHLKSA